MVEATRGTAYTELPWLDACEDVFAAAPGRAAERCRERVRALRLRRKAELEQDRLFLRELFERIRQAPEAAGLPGMLNYQRESFMAVLWERMKAEGVPGPRLTLLREGYERWFPTMMSELWQIGRLVLGSPSLRRGPAEGRREWVQFCLRTAGLAERPMAEREASAMAHPEQLVLWLWESEQVRRARVSGIDTLVARLESVPVARLAEEFEVYQHREQLTQISLADLLEALCRVLRGSPTIPALVLAPLVVWHETRDSRVVDEALDELHWMDPDAFWFLLQSFLNHPDQRLIDTASRAGERAEQTGESGSDRRRDILDGLAEIINEVAGIAVEDVRMGARFNEDLDLDSLSLVEVVVAAEERFDISLPDEDVIGVRTVREAVDRIVNAPSRRR